MTSEAKKIRYAVVGGGQISQQAFMPGIGQTTNSELAALVTGNPMKADKLAKHTVSNRGPTPSMAIVEVRRD